MKYFVTTLVLALSFGCNNAAKPTAQTVNNTAPANVEKPQTAIAHSLENQTPKPASGETGAPGEKSKWTQSGDPIDTKEFDAAITAAEKTLTGKPSDTAAKKSLSTAYLKRAMALTDARQYASALGDYRRALKYDASNAEAKQWIDQIIAIYSSINREYPKEGEEPPPLPMTKGK